MLFVCRKSYIEISCKDLAAAGKTAAGIVTGIVVFILWINMDWTIGSATVPQGFNPTILSEGTHKVVMTLFRIAGAVLVVPLMEELFWRSFLIRYVIDTHFDSVRIGTFTWASFLVTVVLFGLEHNYIYAGVMAGIIYNLLLYRSRSLAHCILAHAVTNLALAVYVVATGKWQFW
jgi:CAAX prenyl protease-like protein